MVTVNELKVLLTGDNSDLKGALKDSEGALEGFGNVAGGALKVAGAAAAAFVGASTALIGTGVKIASDLEQAETRFASLLGSGEEAKAFLEDLKQFSLGTPFDIPSLTAASQRLLALGADADTVIPILQAAGDAAQALGTGSAGVESISSALAKVQQTGQVTTRTLTELVNQGVPAFDFLAQKLGTDVPTAMKMVQDGVVDSGTFIAAFLEGTANKFGGAMEAQSKTFAGMISNVKDELALQLADIAAPLLESFGPLIPQLGGILAELLGTIGPVMAQVVGQIATILAQLLPTVLPILLLIGNAITQLLPALMPLIEAVAAFIPPILELAEALMPLFVMLATALAEAFTQILVALLPVVSTLIAELVPIIEALTPIILQVVENSLAWLPVLEALFGLVVALAPVLQLVGVVMQPLIPILEALNPLIELLASLLVPVIEFITDIIDALVQLVLALTGNQEAWERFAAALERIGTTVVEGIKDLWNGLVDWFQDLGQRIIDGLVEGIRNAWEGAKGVVGDVTGGIKKGFTDALGIASPSTVFMEYGENIVQGLRVGLQDLEGALPMPDRVAVPTGGGEGSWTIVINIGEINVPVTEAGTDFDPKTVGMQVHDELVTIVREAGLE